jgi:hypothetical protein
VTLASTKISLASDKSLDPTQQRRQFLNFFDCPGSASSRPLSGPLWLVVSRRLLNPTTSAARASGGCRPHCWALASTAQSMTITSKSPGLTPCHGPLLFLARAPRLRQALPYLRLQTTTAIPAPGIGTGPRRSPSQEAGSRARAPCLGSHWDPACLDGSWPWIGQTSASRGLQGGKFRGSRWCT